MGVIRVGVVRVGVMRGVREGCVCKRDKPVRFHPPVL